MSQIRKRLNKPAAESVIRYTSSLPFDRRLYRYDIAASIAHAKMLAKQGIIRQQDSDTIIKGLTDISDEIEQARFNFKAELEDIHMAVEARLFELVGDVAGKLHTARSRNDQIALDMRLYVKDTITETVTRLKQLQQSLVELGEANLEVVMPGYTHLQAAQPILLAHHLLAYFEMLQRDVGRFNDTLKRTDVMPLGSGALAGVAYNVDRDFVADELGFSSLSRNSMDAVSDRDFVIEYTAAASICIMHLSRLAEELILWSSTGFDFVELDDAYATGSSIMPQKKNADVAELARGKTGRIYGNLLALLTAMKALPLSYNRDLQEDKESLFDSADTILASLEVFDGMVASLKIKRENMEQAAGRDYILATDLADYLVSKGETFRNAHSMTARLVSYAAGKGKALNQLSLGEYKRFSPLFENGVLSISPASSVAARDITGGTAPQQVKKGLARARKIIGEPDK
jgi:argininosuccinate lyase